MSEERDLRAHLNDLWKTTVEQFDEIKDVIIRNSHVARKKIDAASLKQQRNRLLQELGSSVYQQARDGDLAIGPQGQRYIERLDEVMEQIAAEEEAIARAAEAAPAVAQSDDEPTQENEAVVVDLPITKTRSAEADEAPAEEHEKDVKKSMASLDEAVDVKESSSDKEASEKPKRRRRPRQRRKKVADETSRDGD